MYMHSYHIILQIIKFGKTRILSENKTFMNYHFLQLYLKIDGYIETLALCVELYMKQKASSGHYIK